VSLDLQDVFHAAYESSLYDRRLPYDQPLFPPLGTEDDVWLRRQLREREV
jgi:hypothetical protein